MGMGMHILTRNGDMPHRECTSSLGMETCLTGNGDVTQGMHLLTGNAYPHWECLYRVKHYSA